MNEQVDPRTEQLMREAFAREDVHRFRQLLGDVAARVEKEHVVDDGKVIPIGRKLGWGWIAAAASVALVVTIAINQWVRPDYKQLAYDAALPHTRGTEPLAYYCGEAVLDSAMFQVRKLDPQAALDQLRAYDPTDAQMICRRDWVKALALLMQEKTDEAEVLLRSVAGSACVSEKGYAEGLLEDI